MRIHHKTTPGKKKKTSTCSNQKMLWGKGGILNHKCLKVRGSTCMLFKRGRGMGSQRDGWGRNHEVGGGLERRKRGQSGGGGKAGEAVGK